MELTLKDLTIPLDKIDIPDILSCWQWLLADIETVHTMTCLGDLFLVGKDKGIYWLQCDSGDLDKVAETEQEFFDLLNDEECFDNWFLPELVEKLIKAGKILEENQVYSYRILPVLGGEYEVNNTEPTDMSVHFAIAGQICERIQGLPDGTDVHIVLK